MSNAAIREVASETSGLGIIFSHDHGQVWTNQAGGYACNHPEHRGVFFSILSSPMAESVLSAYFTGPKWGGWCTGIASLAFDEESAHVVDAILKALEDRKKIPVGLRVDRERLGGCMEAWVYVKNDERTGVLVWENSD
jgi:hypothetical protein